MFRRGCEARSKYFSAWTLAGALPARGGLEPAFRVLFSAIFHGFPSGISIRVEICGKEWNQNCSFFVVKLFTKFSCVLAIVCLFTGAEESHCKAVSSSRERLLLTTR